MEHELIDAGPCRKKMYLKFTPEDIDAAFDESYLDINSYVQLKGFRKGKAPRKALEKRFAREAASGVKQSLVEKNVGAVVKEANIQIIGEVSDRTKGELPAPGKPYTLEIEMDVAPDFDVPEYQGMELKEQPVDVTDEQIDQTIDRYRKMFANYEPIEEPAREGDVLKVDFLATAEGQQIMSMEDQRLRVEGEMLFGLPCPELVAKFSGAKTGDVVKLEIVLPDDHPNAELRGKPATIEVTIKGVERGELPALDDAFAAGLGMNTMADFRERIRGNLVREAMIAARSSQEEDILDRLLGAVSYDAPLGMVDSETEALVEQRRMQLTRAGVTADVALKQQLDQYRPEANKQALRKVRWGIMATKIAEKEGITVTNDDMAAQVEALAQSYRTTPQKIIQRIREFDGVAPMMQEILSLKVVQFIIDHAKGGRLDPERQDVDTESVNAAAAESVAHGEGSACGCGHDHGEHGHHHHHHDHGDECGCGHKH